MPSTRTSIAERQCPWCQKLFRKHAHLARHITSHTQAKPFKCDKCQKAFSRQDSLLRHSRLHLQASSPVTTQALGNDPMDATDSEIANPISPILNQNQEHRTDLTGRPPLLTSATRARDELASQRNVVGYHSLPSGHPEEPSGTPRTHCTNADFMDRNSLQAFQTPRLTNDVFSEASTSQWLSSYLGVAEQDQSRSPMYPPKQTVRENWFTYQRPAEEEAQQKAKQSTASSQLQLNDEHRNLLHEKLYQYPSEFALPSTEFLNTCIQKYFSQFHPIFPILHRPTFQAASENALVLLAISCIGCLLQHHKEAVQYGRIISEQLNKAVLNSWVANVEQTGYQALATMQAAVIGQTYALLSGGPRDLAVLSSFHGTVLAWCKQEKYMEEGVNVPEHTSLDFEKSWAVWVRKEQKNRVAAMLHLHDFEMARLFVNEPTLHQSQMPFCWLAPAELWDASSAEHWSTVASRYLDSYKASQAHANSTTDLAVIWGQIARQDDLNLSMKLEHMSAMAIEDNRLGSLPQTEGFIEESLLALFREHLSSRDRDRFMLRSLWHSTFIVSLTDIHRLELAVGKENEPCAGTSNESSEAYARQWAASINAQRAVLHATLLLRELESVPIRAVTPIHVSSSLYHAAMALYCYLRFSPTDRSFTQIAPDRFPEFLCLGVDPDELILEVHDFQRNRPSVEASTILSGLIDMLNRIGYWGLSRSLGCLMVFLTTNCRESRYQP